MRIIAPTAISAAVFLGDPTINKFRVLERYETYDVIVTLMGFLTVLELGFRNTPGEEAKPDYYQRNNIHKGSRF